MTRSLTTALLQSTPKDSLFDLIDRRLAVARVSFALRARIQLASGDSLPSLFFDSLLVTCGEE